MFALCQYVLRDVYDVQFLVCLYNYCHRYESFAANGTLSSSPIMPQSGANGAVAVTVNVAPGTTTTVSIVFAWHFKDRDFSHQILGNMYGEFWENSSAVAKEFGDVSKLSNVVKNINSHHTAVAHPLNPMPVWLKDMLVNQFSHFHMLMWYVCQQHCYRCARRLPIGFISV